MEQYQTIQEVAEKWGISEKRVQVLCKDGRIPGTMRFGRVWAIPESAKKPEDQRIRNGNYVGWRSHESCVEAYGK